MVPRQPRPGKECSAERTMPIRSNRMSILQPMHASNFLRGRNAMNNTTFDRIARQLTRRRSFWLLAAAGTSLFAGREPVPVDARHRRPRCHHEGAPCVDFTRCCSQCCDSLVKGGSCCPCAGRTCGPDSPCCGRLKCVNGLCGGCRDRATACTSSAQCCFSDCGSHGACLSDMNGRCARDVDCAACYLSHNCTNACVRGKCVA